MKKRVLDILSYMMKEIKENSLGDVDLQLFVDVLSAQGFSEDDISMAMSWLMSHVENIHRVIHGQPSFVPRPIWRHLNETERNAISPGAFGYLFHLRELDLVSDYDMERIIEQAVNLDTPFLNVEDMQDLIAAIVLDFENSASNGYFQFTTTSLPH